MNKTQLVSLMLLAISAPILGYSADYTGQAGPANRAMKPPATGENTTSNADANNNANQDEANNAAAAGATTAEALPQPSNNDEVRTSQAKSVTNLGARSSGRAR